MTNTRRNTVVLSSLLMVIVISTLLYTRHLTKQSKHYKKQNARFSGEIIVLDDQISNIDSLKRQYAIQQEMIAQQSKLILNEDSPTITFNYLLDVLTWMGRDINFDFAISGKPQKNVQWNEYVISGKSHFASLVELVNNIEHQRSLITVEELSIGNDNIAFSDSVSFSMVFRTHYKAGGSDPSSITAKAINGIQANYMLFKSRIFENARSVSEDSRFIDLDKVVLIGLTDNRVFLRDSQGIIRILSIGDRVAFGYLNAINLNEGKAVFRVDTYGVPEDKTLFIRRTN